MWWLARLSTGSGHILGPFIFFVIFQINLIVMDVIMLASVSDCNHKAMLQMTVKHLTALDFSTLFMANLSVNRLYNQAVGY